MIFSIQAIFEKDRMRLWLPAVLVGAISGAILTLGFAPYSLAMAGLSALAPMAWFFVSKPRSPRIGFLAGYALGVVHFLSSLGWLTYVTWAGFLVLSFYIALFPALWGGIMAIFSGGPRPEAPSSSFNISFAFVGACAWVLTEWLRGWLFSGFAWNFLGVSQKSLLPLIQVAELGGVQLISFIAAFFGLMLGLGIWRIRCEVTGKAYRSAHFDFFLALALLVMAFMFGVKALTHVAPVTKQLTFLAIQPNIPQQPWKPVRKEVALAKINELTQLGLLEAKATGKKIDVIFWPEASVVVNINDDVIFRGMVQRLANDAPLVFGTDDYVPPNIYNTSMFFPKTGEPRVYYKRHLVPFGEFVPFSELIPALRWCVPASTDFSAGTEARLFDLPSEEGIVKAAPLICFEDTTPGVVRESVALGPDFFVNQTNDAWFERSPQPQQHFDNAIFRAIEYRRPLLRVTNNGITGLVNDRGREESLLRHAETGSLQEEGYLIGNVPIRPYPPTLYQLWGDWIVWVSLAVVLLALLPAAQRWIFRKKR